MTRSPKPASAPAPVLPPAEGGSFLRLPDGTLVPETPAPALPPADPEETVQ